MMNESLKNSRQFAQRENLLLSNAKDYPVIIQGETW